jgi:acyl carrier protein
MFNVYAMEKATKTDAIEMIVKDLIAERAGIDVGSIHSDSSFIYDLGIDSLDFIAIVSEFEKIFRIRIGDEEIERIVTVRDLVEYVRKNIQ